MQYSRSSKAGLRKRAITGAIAAAFAVTTLTVRAGDQVPPDQNSATDADDQAVAASRAAPAVYSVINMAPDGSGAAMLSARGGAAFGSFGYTGTQVAFFDGDRVHNIGSLGGTYTWIYGLNKHGVVVGESDDAEEHSNTLGFAWTVRGGTRGLPGLTVASARAINDANQIVGLSSAPGISARAVRWNTDGTVTPLGPVPLSLSQAYAVNECGIATGFADVTGGAIHATVWDRAGTVTDLGTLGGSAAFGMFVNNCTAVAGVADSAAGDRTLGFYWSRNTGMVPINVEGGGARLVADLNNKGEVVGDTTVGERTMAYHWSLRRGVVPLPIGAAEGSDVFDINNNSEMVGRIYRRPVDGGGSRAVRWAGLSMPVDLNTRLHRPPAGLVLEAGAAINEDGVILAHTNAGLVLLRPGKRGTDAPVLGPISGLPYSVELGQDLALALGFVDNNAAQTHRASVTWTDACPSPAPAVSETGGVGQVRLQHRFCAAGLHSVAVKVTDSGGRSTIMQKDVLVEAPGVASVSGRGTLPGNTKLSGRLSDGLPLRFALWMPLAGATADKPAAGTPLALFSGPFQFRSDQIKGAAAGQQVRLEGTGRLNGRGGYRFALDASDGGANQGADRIRVRITHPDAAGGDVVDYDNGAPSRLQAAAGPDRTVPVEGDLTLRH
jgi:hypothetical protein